MSIEKILLDVTGLRPTQKKIVAALYNNKEKLFTQREISKSIKGYSSTMGKNLNYLIATKQVIMNKSEPRAGRRSERKVNLYQLTDTYRTELDQLVKSAHLENKLD